MATHKEWERSRTSQLVLNTRWNYLLKSCESFVIKRWVNDTTFVVHGGPLRRILAPSFLALSIQNVRFVLRRLYFHLKEKPTRTSINIHQLGLSLCDCVCVELRLWSHVYGVILTLLLFLFLWHFEDRKEASSSMTCKWPGKRLTFSGDLICFSGEPIWIVMESFIENRCRYTHSDNRSTERSPPIGHHLQHHQHYHPHQHHHHHHKNQRAFECCLLWFFKLNNSGRRKIETNTDIRRSKNYFNSTHAPLLDIYICVWTIRRECPLEDWYLFGGRSGSSNRHMLWITASNGTFTTWFLRAGSQFMDSRFEEWLKFASRNNVLTPTHTLLLFIKMSAGTHDDIDGNCCEHWRRKGRVLESYGKFWAVRVNQLALGHILPWLIGIDRLIIAGQAVRSFEWFETSICGIR